MVEKDSNVPIGRYVAGGPYDKEFISKIVAEVLNGKPRQIVKKEYGIKSSTLQRWLRENDLMVNMKRVGRASIDVKRSAVRSVVSGRLSMREAQLTYGVKTARTIENWMKELEQENTDLAASNKSWMQKNKSIKKDTTTTESKADIKALQTALEEAQLKIAALNTLIDVAEEQLKINIRKKPGAKQSND